LKQVVCVKQVPDTETRVKVGPDGKGLDPAGVTWVLNPYDEFAVEEALRQREKQGEGEVIAISLGGPGVQTTLRNALALGADRAIHLRADGTSEPLAVARALAAELRGLGADLVWFGKQAVDDDQAQVGPMVAELLELPCATAISTLALEGGRARVEREIEGGREVVELELPAVLTADKGLNEPRYASLKGIMAAKKKPMDVKKVSDYGVAVEAQIKETGVELPPPRAAGQFVPDVATLVKKLADEAKAL